MTDYANAAWTTGEHAEVERLLRAAGWYPGRDERRQIAAWRATLEADGRFRLHATAETVLAEFGGLHVGGNEPGVERARTDIRFDPTSRRTCLWPVASTTALAARSARAGGNDCDARNL